MKTDRATALRNPPAAEFSALHEAFRRAVAPGCRVAYRELGGNVVRFRVAGAALAEGVLEPTQHLACDPPADRGHVELEIDLWDGLATGVRCAGCAVRPELTESRPQLAGSADGRIVSYRRADSVVVFDRASRRMIGWFADGANLAFPERGRPLGAPLVLWCHDRGVEVVHGAMITHGEAGVLVGGAGGSGKTTCALRCLQAGFRYLGDDYVGLRADGEAGFTGYSLYASAYAEADHLARFADLSAHAVADRSGRETKRMIPLTRVPGAVLERSAPVRAAIVPRVTASGATSYRRVTAGEAFLRLAPSSLFALPHVRKERLDILARLVETVPAFRLDLGRDIEEIPGRVLDILREIGAS